MNAFRIGSIIQKELEDGGRFESLVPPLSSLKNLHFIQFRKSMGTENAYGLAVSRDMRKAQIVSYFEYLDRKAFHENWKRLNLRSTNGVAAHKFRFLAKQAAISELIERDSFLIHWHSQTPFKSIAGNLLTDQISEDLCQQNFSLNLFETTLGLKKTVVCILINEKTGGFCVGSSSGKGSKGDIEKAAVEAVINLCFGGYGKNTDQLISDLELNGMTNLESHRTFWLYKAQAPNWLRSKKANQFEVSVIDPEFKTMNVAQDPFPVVAVQSPKLFQLVVGPPSAEELSKLTRRLKGYTSASEGDPHPLF